jgi:triosephosphate isomerase
MTMSGQGRRRIVAGNWKMHTDLAGARALAAAVAEAVGDAGAVEVVLIPPACFLAAVAEAVAGSAIRLGAQNVHDAASGAFTGELAAAMLADVGCTYVVCGHSERRHVFGESPQWIGRKVAAVIAAGLTPILCVGETLEEREADRTEAVVAEQLIAGLGSLTAAQVRATVIAYEPVWAIGTGRTASPAQAQAVHATLRGLLAQRYDDATAQAVRIQYGGSVKPDNAAELLGQPDIDGALVGGASLQAHSFAAIIAA